MVDPTGYSNPKHRVIVNTTENPVPVQVPGGVQATSPPPNDVLITTLLISDIPQTLPEFPAPDRVGVEFENLGVDVGGTGETLFWNRSAVITTVLAAGTSYGKRLRPNESSNFELAGGKDIYAVAEAGKEVWVQVTEWLRLP